MSAKPDKLARMGIVHTAPTSGNDETPEDRVARIKRRWEAGFGPVATTPIEMLEFLRDRFRMGVGQAVAESYAEDIDMMLAGIVPTSGNDEVTDALRLILPLAKGYMAAHPIESNIRYVHTAEAALANVDAHPPVQPTEPNADVRIALERIANNTSENPREDAYYALSRMSAG